MAQNRVGVGLFFLSFDVHVCMALSRERWMEGRRVSGKQHLRTDTGCSLHLDQLHAFDDGGARVVDAVHQRLSWNGG